MTRFYFTLNFSNKTSYETIIDLVWSKFRIKPFQTGSGLYRRKEIDYYVLTSKKRAKIIKWAKEL